jgi:hypothetical protein
MFARWTKVDMRATVVVTLEPGKLLENGGGGNIVEAGEHTSGVEDAEIVERGVDGGEQIGDGRLNPVHGARPFARVFEPQGGGRGGGNWTPRAKRAKGRKCSPPARLRHAIVESAPALYGSCRAAEGRGTMGRLV